MPQENPREKALTDLIRQVRTCFNQLRSLAERLHYDLGINPSMRAVMESLATRGAQTVPEIARSKGVSRQHIQTVMNTLLEECLVELRENPAHRRSPQFDLTITGRDVFTGIREREHAPLRRLATAVPARALREARATLAALNARLADEIAATGGREDA